jgi:DNA-directed RNA polymerase subunit RPC12/RpoP
MEIEKSSEQNSRTTSSSDHEDLIQVRATISCENCGYKKRFRNQFPRSQIELFVVSAKVFDFMTCTRCGNLLKLDLEFNF